MALSYISLILSLGLLVLLVYLGPIRTFTKVFDISEHILNETRFYLKANPAETCVITELFSDGLAKPKLHITVTKPDASTHIKTITLKEFNNLWMIEE